MAARAQGLPTDQLVRLAPCALAKYLYTRLIAETNGGWLPPHLVEVRRQAVRELTANGSTQTDIAAIGNTSRPRVSQLCAAADRTAVPPRPNRTEPDHLRTEPDRTGDPNRTEPPTDQHTDRSHHDTPMCTGPNRTG